jgi:hypothetical protein
MPETPWGRVQHRTRIAHGITFVSTARHGGVRLSPSRAALIPATAKPWTGDPRFWEEDCDYHVPAVVFEAEFRAWYLSQGRDADALLDLSRNAVRRRPDVDAFTAWLT